MTVLDARSVPADTTSEDRLASRGLAYRVVDMNDAAAADDFLKADSRGFLDQEPTDETLRDMRASMSERRNIGVFDDSVTQSLPIATVNSWVTPMTVPGGEVPMWAISSVTVAATHRRRGIARALLEGELRAAASSGIAVAGLTASEATIYGRYGFGPAVPVAHVKIDTPRAGWAGAAVTGRVLYADKKELSAALGEVHERSRGARAGQIAGWPGRWERMAGIAPGDSGAASVRGVRYFDEEGEVRGALAYTLKDVPGAFRSELAVRHLAAETPEALRALWSFVIHHDLVSSATVDLRPIDDPLPWLVADPRAVDVTVHDHGWLRILDVPTALAARSYRAPLEVVLRVEDALGFAAGSWRLTVDARGSAQASPAGDTDADVTLDVSALSSLYAGGVSAVQLHAAGRLDTTPEVAASIDDAFRASPAPLLGIWY